MARKKVSTEPTYQSWNDVDKALKEIADCESCITEIEVDMNRQINEAKDDADKMSKPAKDRVKKLELCIKEFVEANRVELDGKTKMLNFGKTGYRISTKMVIPSIEEAIVKIKQHNMLDCLNIKESINKDVLKKYPVEEIIKTGGYLKQTDEFWYETFKEELQ
ncbi:MAG: host-nuclease inhibitor Gam family protein [Oscillospiraceae bacterium]